MRRKDRKGRRDRAWLRSDLTSKVRVSIRPDCEGTCFALPQQRQQQRLEQRRSADMRVLEQQLYSRLVFYGRFMNAALPFRTGDPPGYPRGRRLDVGGRGKGGGRERRKREKRNGCSGTRIFTRKGLSVIYWKSLPRSCGFVASPRETSCKPYVATRDACCMYRN